MNTYGLDLMGRRRRRRHTDEFKATVVAECMTRGVSIAAVALAHGLNANMLRKWLVDAGTVKIAAQPPSRPLDDDVALPHGFVPLALKSAHVEGDIRIELVRAGTTVNIIWPAAAAADCAAWLREWLR